MHKGKLLAGRHLLVIGMALALVIAVAACGEKAAPAPAPAPAPAAKPAPAPAPAPAAKPAPAPAPAAKPAPAPKPVQQPVELRVSHHLSPGYSYSQSMDKWGDAVEKATGGKVTVTIYGAQSLIKAKEQLDAVSKGVVEAAFVPHPYASAKVPLLGAAELPFNFSDYRHMANAASMGLMDLYNKEGFNKINIMEIGETPINWSGWGTNSTLIKEPKDFDQKIVRVFGAWQAKMIEPLGAKAAWMSSSDIYTALQRGTVDAYITTGMSNIPRKLYEVAKTWTAGTIFAGNLGMWINMDTWNSLTPETQQILKDLYQDIMVEKQMRIMDTEDFEALELLKDAGLEVYFINDEEATTVWEAPLSKVKDTFRKELGTVGEQALGVIKRAAP
ncbi:MAG: TRAP transporter substrate-binding protein DctP [Dehalococcoidia bacterium]|nr:TRAP transporter substrate-binding protein DctP [Dehalococcoidia bacterium]